MPISSAFSISRYNLSSQFEFISFTISPQFRPGTDTEETEVADACSRRVVLYDSYNNMCMAPVMVCLPLYTFPEVSFSTCLRIMPILYLYLCKLSLVHISQLTSSSIQFYSTIVAALSSLSLLVSLDRRRPREGRQK